MAAVSTRNIVKKFGEVPAVNGISLETAGHTALRRHTASPSQAKGVAVRNALDPLMSALPPKADITKRDQNVCFVPKADVSKCSKNPLWSGKS